MLFFRLLLACFSIAGFYAGISSLLHIHQLFEMKYSEQKSRRFIAIICFLSSFGVYLGRILRFNSWDIFSHPIDLFDSILNSILIPETQRFTVVFGTFIIIIYSISYLLFNEKTIKS